MRTTTSLRRTLAVALVLAVGVVSGCSGTGDSDDEAAPDDAKTRVSAQAGGPVAFKDHAGTGTARLLDTDSGHPVPRPEGVSPDAGPPTIARAVLEEHGSVFGVRDQARQLRLRTTKRTARGGASVRFEQMHRGVPVLAGELIVHLDDEGNTDAVNGELSPDPEVGVEPEVAAAVAARTAAAQIARSHGVDVADTDVARSELVVYDPALLGGAGVGDPRLVWRTEVTGDSGEPFRELVLVDALRGSVTLHFDELAHALERYVCDNANFRSNDDDCSSGYARTEGGAPTGNADVDRAYDFGGDTYDFYAALGRDSIDDNGLALRSTVRFCPASTSEGGCPFANAYWNGAQMVYGAGFTADDVVGHELTHGVTDAESRLFYYYQSGAINESLSDVFGELIDLENGAGNDDPSVRWKLGEDVPGGAIRDMANPPAKGDPDRMRSPSYHANASDNGGVHINSGVNNKAAALLVDGGTFNGQTVNGLGADKVARLYYTVATEYLTSGSDYQDLYDTLQLACEGLVGTNGFVDADCDDVTRAVDATEMNLQPTAAGAQAVDAPICPTGEVPVDQFFEDLERPSANRWLRASHVGSRSWAYPQNPNLYSSQGWDPTYATSGRYNMWGDDPQIRTQFSIAMVESVAVLPGRTTYLRFNHAYSFDSDGSTAYDGGVVEYQIDGGPWVDAKDLFTHNGYPRTITTAEDNPLAGRPAFSGLSHGYYSSRLDLTSLSGHRVQLRWMIGTGTGFGADGWWLDDIRIYSCAERATGPTGDFDGDGYADVAIGAPGEDVGSKTDAGTVQVLYGSESGITGARRQAWNEDSAGVVGASEAGDRFGAAIVAADFNGDGFDDLAVGVPGEDIGTNKMDAGAVDVLYGGASGLTANGDEEWQEDTSGIVGTAENGDRFGTSLAAGDFEADGDDDLAVGSPAEDVGSVKDAGQAHVLYGNRSGGLANTGNALMSQATGTGVQETGDAFAAALAAGDFDGDGADDVAIGSPSEDAGGIVDAGAVQIALGSTAPVALDAPRATFDGALAGETAETGDKFGSALAAGYFDTGPDGSARRADLAVGVPLENRTATDEGVVIVLPGGPDGPSADAAELLTQAGLGIEGGSEKGDTFGAALAAGPTAGDGPWSLVVGTPLEDAGGTLNAGAVVVVSGSGSGLVATGAQQWLDDESGDRLGTSVAAGDFDQDGDADVAAGVPNEDNGSVVDAGLVRFFAGASDGVTVASTATWIEPSDENGDTVGAAVASGIG